MESEKITVIIPVYNTERFVEKCVRSVCGQTYRNLEIILVDDGSTDGSPEVCDRLAREDGRISVLHRENGGASAARNAGLDIATGEYVGFIDSDDYIAPNMYERLYQALTEADAELSVCDFAYVDERGNSLTDIPPIPAGVRGCKQALELVEFGQEEWRYISLVNRLYKRELFANYRLVEGKICEDEFAAHPIYAQCRRVAFIADVLYWDVKRENSVMTSPVSIKRLAGAEARLARYDFFRERGWNKLARSTLRRAYASVWLVVKNVNVWRYRDEIRPYMEQVTKALQNGWIMDIMRAVRLKSLYRRRERETRPADGENPAA